MKYKVILRDDDKEEEVTVWSSEVQGKVGEGFIYLVSVIDCENNHEKFEFRTAYSQPYFELNPTPYIPLTLLCTESLSEDYASVLLDLINEMFDIYKIQGKSIGMGVTTKN